MKTHRCHKQHDNYRSRKFNYTGYELYHHYTEECCYLHTISVCMSCKLNPLWNTLLGNSLYISRIQLWRKDTTRNRYKNISSATKFWIHDVTLAPSPFLKRNNFTAFGTNKFQFTITLQLFILVLWRFSFGFITKLYVPSSCI